jgi:DNA polymerase III subunit delta'
VSAFPWHRAALAAILSERERMPHALLVQGASGIGKVEFARAVAQGLLCESPRAGLACEACAACHWFSQSNHPDYREIVPEASEESDEEATQESAKADAKKSLVIKVDQIRAVADFISLSTHRAGFRVLLLRPAEAMQPAAANALLKTLEEPPPATIILLVADRPARLLATIRSRCRPLVLAMPPREEALAWLAAQGTENAEVFLALAGGAPLLALELADAAEEPLRKKVIGELARPGGAHPLAFATGFDRPQVERMLFWMQTWVHDLVRVKTAGRARHHVDNAPALAAKAKRADLDRLLGLDRELVEAKRLAGHPLNARLLAEHLLMAYNRATLPDSR